MSETKREQDASKVSHERDVSMRLFAYGTPLRTQKMLAAEKILREEYPAYTELVKALEAARLVIMEELAAAGNDEIKQHPTLRKHAKVLSQIRAALTAARKKV